MRVVVNFLSNAIKYSTPGETVRIAVFELTDAVEVQVIERGAGIAPQYLTSIFARYTQISRFDHTQKQGSGLGLAICTAIIDAHGGSIGVTSKIGEGSVFWFRIAKA